MSDRRLSERLSALASTVTEAVREWAAGKIWWWRAPILLWLAYIGVCHLADPLYNSLFGGLNLGIHEAGHLVLVWAPQFVMAFGGTFFQCAAPIVAAWLFVRQPDWFAIPVCGAWLGDNLYGVATYMGDARALELPLVSVGGGEVEHDWSYMLDAVGLLEWDTTLATLVRLFAFALMWSSLAAGVWVLWTMAHARKSP